MQKIFKILFVVILAIGGLCACDDKDKGSTQPLRTSVVTLSKSSVGIGYEDSSFARVKVTVPRFGWRAETDADWLTLSPDSTQNVGTTELMLFATGNTDAEPRSTVVTIYSGNVKGELKVTQVGYGQEVDDVKHPDGNANKWMYEQLQVWYLWNDLLQGLYPDYDCSYDVFLDNTLIPLKGNELDGGRYEDGSRYLYSYVTRAASSRAAVGYPAFGFATLSAVGADNNKVYLRVTSINPDSPADRAQIRRGEYISRINGLDITRANWMTMYNRLLYPSGGSVTITMMESSEVNGDFYFNEGRTVTLSAANIGNNPIVAAEIVEHDGKKVGYFAYNSFQRGPTDSSIDYDIEMEQAFEMFATEGIDGLVIDLRYNGGGSVSSCQKLLSMIAPREKLGTVAFTLRHNASIEPQLSDDEKNISLLEDYADANVNMSKVCVIATDMSASASEMVIAGLRGLDVAVSVIGSTTEGKNVGMDVMSKHIDGYDYTFAPITFQIYNAKGYTDYQNGIRADYTVDEWEDLRSNGWRPLGDPEEVMFQMALTLIGGSRTQATRAAETVAVPAGFERLRVYDPRRESGAKVWPDDDFTRR